MKKKISALEPFAYFLIASFLISVPEAHANLMPPPKVPEPSSNMQLIVGFVCIAAMIAFRMYRRASSKAL
jgi:hypothetical protein